MANWVRLCAVEEVPAAGDLREIEVEASTICLANIDGELRALDNLCPHREGPLGQGWIEGQTVVCPWHAWAFDCRTGLAEPPERAQVKVYPVRREEGTVLVDLS
ncbi:MAG: Rieske (2Fe-2S) protein [Janthinobacterium lividum]